MTRMSQGASIAQLRIVVEWQCGYWPTLAKWVSIFLHYGDAAAPRSNYQVISQRF